MYVVHRKSLAEFQSDVAGALPDNKEYASARLKLANIFRRGGEIDRDLTAIDDAKLLGQVLRREWTREDFATDLEYLVTATTADLKPLEQMVYRLATYETGIAITIGRERNTRAPIMGRLRIHLLATVDGSKPFDVWVEFTDDPNHRGGPMRTLHGWRKKERGKR